MGGCHPLWHLSVLLIIFMSQTNAETLTPPYFNLAEGRKITASSTCGVDIDGPELYCKLVGSHTDDQQNQTLQYEDQLGVLYPGKGHVVIQGQQCDYCTEGSHPVEYAIDGSEKWWQSPPLSRGMKYNEVNLTIDFGQEFHVAYVFIRMGNSPRPGLWTLEKSSDYGKTWKPWQHFSDSETDCEIYFGRDSLKPIRKDDDVICTTEFSKIVPLESGEIIVRLLNSRPSANNYFNSTTLQEWTRATNVRIRLLRTKNLLGHLMSVARQDPTVTRRYFYSIKDISIGGRCVCNGHANTCTLDPRSSRNNTRLLACSCQHNTCGMQCERCCEGFEQKKWRQNTKERPFQCEPCNCHGHSNKCVYSEEVDIRGESLDIHGKYDGGGVCQDCMHNTEGNNCNKCKPRFYRPYGKLWNETDVCQPCNCDHFYSTGNCEEESGRCECRVEFQEPNCDSCSEGHFGYPNCRPCECFLNGTQGYHCESTDGKCPCKSNFAGDFCRECAPGYFNFPECKPCDCNEIGSDGSTCDSNGQCICKPNYSGKKCDQCKDGYYDWPGCAYCQCDIHGTEPEICNKATGECLCKEGYGSGRCDRCIPGYFNYPECVPCNCSTAGSVSTTCDHNGKCPCLQNFAGKRCDQCMAGFYQFPECLPCNCDTHGSNGITCNSAGQCNCQHNFDGKTCNMCKENFYNYPLCESCDCNPAGVIAKFAGCGSVPAGELCQCKERAQGRICDQCRPLYWNLNVSNPDGCEECDCFTDGTIGALDTCETKSGQCSCKKFVGGRRCDECVDGTFDLFGTSLYGCKQCDCDIGGSISPICNKQSGECRCHPRITSRDCTRPLQLHYYPTLYQLKHEYEDGSTSTGAQVRYQFDEEIFPDFSKIGYAVFSQLQSEISNEVNIQKSSFYRLIIRYVNPGEEPVIADISIQSENPLNPDQDGKVVFKPNKRPEFVTMSGIKGDIPTPIVLDPGKYTIMVKTDQPLFLDYFVLLPAAYYEASILTRKVVNPCKVNSPSSLCRLYRYPSINSYGPVTKPTINGGIPAAEFYRNYEHLSQVNEQELPIISRSQSELNYKIQVPKPGRYVLVLDYITDSSFSDAVFLSVNQADSQDPDGIILLYPCTYQMVCRGPIMDKESREKVFFIDIDEQTPFVINGDSISGVAIKSLTAIPYDEWTPDFIQPQPVCVMKNGACVEATFISPPNSKKIEFEVDQEERVAVENVPEIITNGTKTIFINKDSESVQFSGKVHESGHYVIIVGYFQPNHPQFKIFYRLQTENQNYDGKFTLNHCPSTSGCRGIIQQDNGYAWFDIEDTFTFSFTNTNQYGVWLDYIILVPIDVYNDPLYNERILNEEPFDQTAEFLKECGQDHFNIQLNASEFCKSSVFSLTAEYNAGALPCNCHPEGSKSFECESFGGQCQCKPNIVGRMCEACRTGYFGFPDCKPCDCPSTAICEKRTGECICPPRVKGEKCDKCEDFTFGFDQIIGCEDCNCNEFGVLDGNLQCDLNNGSCICAPNVVGRACDKCAYGFFNFPYCGPCRCDLRGTILEVCDQEDETCFCKKNVQGRECNQCIDGTYNLQEKNPEGCTKCFCFGKTTRCENAYLRQFEVSMMKNITLHTINIKGGKMNNTNWLTEEPIMVNETTASVELGDVDNPELLDGFAYFGMLDYFTNQNNHLSAYGGNLHYSLFYTTKLFGNAQIGPDVILEAKDIRIKHMNYRQPAANQKFEGTVEMIESNFQTLAGSPVSRETFMTVLRDLSKIYIRASYFSEGVVTYINDVTLTFADEDPENYHLYKEIAAEKCMCPPGYEGLSCENCAPGYYRDPNGPYGGYCIPCDCNGHSATCNCDTGVCDDCQHHTTGDHCEMCVEGYYGNATFGTPYDCMICACPLPIDSNNFATGCEVSPDGYSISCDCKPGYTGHKCQSCASGYYGTPEVEGEICKPCDCSGNIDPSMPDSCDSVSGECIHCLNNTFGTACNLCAPGYFGDAIIRKDCKSCICDDLGTDYCDSSTGECRCHNNVEGEKCDRCLPDHYGFDSGYGCLPCDCGVASNSTQCEDNTGECACKPGVGGRQCDRCLPGFWDYGPDGCKPCSCNTELSRGLGCNPITGQCECLKSVIGEKCDSCPPRWVFIENYGCEECDGCHHALLDVTDDMEKEIDPVVDEFSEIAQTYYTTQKLKKLNEDTEELKPLVEQLDPNKNNLNEETNEIETLEMDVKNHQKKSNYVKDKAADLKMASADLQKKAAEDRLTYRNVLDDVRATIREVSALADNLYVDEKTTLIDEAVRDAENYLDSIKGFDPEVLFKFGQKPEQCKVDDIIDQVDNFIEPINEQKKKLDDFNENLVDFNNRLNDLREKARESQAKSLAAEQINKKNKESRLIQNLEAISNSYKESENALKEAKGFTNEGKKLLTEIDLSYQDAGRINKGLDELSEDLEKIIPNKEDQYKEIATDVGKAFDHALELQRKKDELENQYSNITANSNDAIKAAGAYAEIVHHIDVAKNLSQKGKEDADKAWELVQGLGDKAGKSQQESSELNHEGRDALSSVQHDLKPSLDRTLDDLNNLKENIEKYEKGLKKANETIDNIKSEPQTDAWNNIIKQADESIALMKTSNEIVEPIFGKMDGIKEINAQLSKNVEDTKKDIALASNQVNKVGDLVPKIISMVDEQQDKQDKLDVLDSQIGYDIERLRRQIAQARSIANSIKLGVQFMPNTTLELKTPENLQSQAYNTKVSTFFRTDKPNGFLMYLGNEPKQGTRGKRDDFMAIEIENGYPVLLIDMGDGPERIINSKLVDDNKWYEAIVERQGKDVTFTIRDEDGDGNEVMHEKKETLPGDKTNFRLDENSKLFVGGYSDYQMPDSIKQSAFEGEIEGLKIGDSEVGLWNFVDGQNNNLGAIERDRIVDRKAKYTGYRFGGNGYVALDAKPFNFKTRSHIKFRFKAGLDSPNGLLFLVGHDRHYISLELRNGNIVFQFKLGQSSETVEIKSDGVFNDDEWHTVSAARDSGEGSLIVDEHVLYKNALYSPDSSYQPPDKMYFGGSSDRIFVPGIQKRNFDGCIDEVEIEGTPLDLSRNIEAYDVLPGCPIKFSAVVGFSKDNYGHIKMKELNVPNKLNINLKFKTRQSNGVIFYGMNNDQSATVSLVLDNGVLVFRSSKFELNSEEQRYNDGKWHVVTVTHDMRQLRMSIDDKHEYVSAEAPPTLYIQSGEIYFGGLPNGFKAIGGAVSNDAYFVGCIQDVLVNANVINFASSNDKSNAILNNCPRDIVDYNPQDVFIYYPSGNKERPKDNIDIRFGNEKDNEIEGSDTTEKPIEKLTTKAPETTSTIAIQPITVSTATTESTTTKRPYTPDEKHPECVLPAIPNYDVDFDAGYRFGTQPSSYVEFEPRTADTKNSYAFSLTFKTDKQNGLLFYASDERHTDFVGVYLKDGYVTHYFSCRNLQIKITSKHQFDNNEWHTIEFTRDKKKFALKDIDRSDNKLEELQGLKCPNMDLSKNYFIGGASEKASEDIEINLGFDKGYLTKHAFFGCIKDAKFNNDPLEVSGGIPESVLPCSDQIEKGVFFGKSGGYVKLREKFKVGSDLTISMDIKPRNLTGILTSVHGKKSFFIVEMIKGNIHFSVDSGDGPRNVIFVPDPDKSLCDGNWHTVTVIKSRFILSINVDQFSSEPNVGNPEKHTIVDTTRPLFIGGHPHLAKIRGLKGRSPFQGCIRNIKINDNLEKVTTQMTTGHVETGVCHLN